MMVGLYLKVIEKILNYLMNTGKIAGASN